MLTITDETSGERTTSDASVVLQLTGAKIPVLSAGSAAWSHGQRWAAIPPRCAACMTRIWGFAPLPSASRKFFIITQRPHPRNKNPEHASTLVASGNIIFSGPFALKCATAKEVSMSTVPAEQHKPNFWEVGARVRAARAKVGMTRRQLAISSGSSERYLAQIEAGVANPSLSVLTGLAGALDMAVADLLPKGGERTADYMEAAAALRRLPLEGLDAFNRWISGTPTDVNKSRRIVLLGLRGAGKSSLGRELAERLQVPFLEMSKEVELAYGGEIGVLIELSGQAALRRYESEVWEAIRQKHDAAVVAAPGGIVADAPVFDRMLATSHSIWLKATPEDHMERVMAQGDFRPMASNRAAMADLKAILEARSGEYARADVEVETSRQNFSETIDLLETVARDLVGHRT